MTAAIATREKVFAAADKLFAEGQPVTQARICKAIGGGSHSTISKLLREWKELEDNTAPIKDYPIPDLIKKEYDRISQEHWNAFIRFYEPIIESEITVELQKRIELLEAQLELAKQASIRLEESEKYRKELSEQNEKLTKQQRADAAEIRRLEDFINMFHSKK